MAAFNPVRAVGTENPTAVSPEPPFLVEHLRRDVTPSGSFTPDAQIILTRALRTSGLLAALPDNETRSLFALLAFLSANGRIEATASQVGEVLKISDAKALDRLRRLCRVRWQDAPVAFERAGKNGVSRFGLLGHVVGAHAVGMESERALAEKPFQSETPVAAVAAGRQAIIEHSRAAYGRPRADVEREIAEQLGYLHVTASEQQPQKEINPLASRLIELGVPPEQANGLVASHSEAEISEQLDWLPLRGAKNPARFIVAAIQNKYEPPARVRLERAIAAEEASKEQASLPSPPPELPVGESTILTVPSREQEETEPSNE